MSTDNEDVSDQALQFGITMAARLFKARARNGVLNKEIHVDGNELAGMLAVAYELGREGATFTEQEAAS